MSETGLVRRVNAGSYLYMKQKNRTGAGQILAQSKHGVQVTVAVDATEEESHFDAARYFSPIVIDATNNLINFKATSGGSELTATVASGTYADPKNLATAVRDALNAADVGAGNREWVVSWDSDTYKFTITHLEETTGEGDYFDILWKTGTNGSDNTDTHIGTALGFDDTADDLSTGDALVTGEWLAVSTGGADVLPAPAHVPLTSPTVYANGVALVDTTDYAIVLATGVVTLVNGQTTVGDVITIDYTWQSPLANASKTADNAVGTVPSWTSKPNIVVPAQAQKFSAVPAGKILRFKCDVGEMELTFFGTDGWEDPQPQGRFSE